MTAHACKIQYAQSVMPRHISGRWCFQPCSAQGNAHHLAKPQACMQGSGDAAGLRCMLRAVILRMAYNAAKPLRATSSSATYNLQADHVMQQEPRNCSMLRTCAPRAWTPVSSNTKPAVGSTGATATQLPHQAHSSPIAYPSWHQQHQMQQPCSTMCFKWCHYCTRVPRDY
jgi:hypothetical protein